MGFVMGSSCFLHPPLRHRHRPSSSSQCALLYMRDAEKQRKHRVPMASLSHEGDSNDTIFCKRRAVLFVGISVLPFLSSRARALEDLANGEFGYSFAFQDSSVWLVDEEVYGNKRNRRVWILGFFISYGLLEEGFSFLGLKQDKG